MDINFNQKYTYYSAQINVTVDGGTYKWLCYLKEQGIDLLNENHNEYVPNLITGDMDSCSPIILEKLKNMGSIIIETPDQDHTDYAKALFQLGQYVKMKNIKVIMNVSQKLKSNGLYLIMRKLLFTAK